MLDFWRTNQYWFGKERNLDPAELTSDQRMSLAHAIRNRLLYAIDHPHALQLLPDLRDVPWIQIAAQIQIYADWFDYIA